MVPGTQKAPSVTELVDCSVICQFLGLELGVPEGICFYRRGRGQGRIEICRTCIASRHPWKHLSHIIS